MKKINKLIAIMVLSLVLLTGCGSKNAVVGNTYESEDKLYKVEFKEDSKCTWYQDGTFFDGTYKKTDEGYSLNIVGNGLYSNTVFEAEVDGKELIISGGTLSDVKFSKE